MHPRFSDLVKINQPISSCTHFSGEKILGIIVGYLELVWNTSNWCSLLGISVAYLELV